MKTLVIIFLFLISATNSLAVSNEVATPAADKNNLQDIQKIREVVQQKVKEKLQQIGDDSEKKDTNSPKSFVGTITQINGTQITIDYKNSPKSLSVDDTTVFIDAKKNKTQLDKIKVGQDVLAMGYLNSDDTLTVKRLIISDLKTITNNNQVIIGKIVDISKSSPIFVLIPSKNKNNQFQIKTDTTTTVFNKSNTKSDIKNLVSGDKVIVVITPDQKIAKTFSALKIITQDK